MASLLDGIGGYVTSELLGKAAASLGESESGIAKVIGGLAPTILAGLVGKSNDSSLFSSLFDTVVNKVDGGVLDNLGDLLSDGNLAQGDPRDVAGGVIGSLFGDKVGSILSAITSGSGVKASSSSSLLGMVGPMVLGFLAKKIAGGGLDIAGFKNLLLGEKDEIEAAVPATVGPILGLTSVASIAPAAATTAVNEVRSTQEESSGGWMWPLILLLGVLGALWYFFFRGDANEATVAPPPVERTTVVESAAPAMADTPVASYVRRVGDYELIGNAGGVEEQLISFIESDAAPCKEAGCWFTFDRLTFSTGSANLNLSSSAAQLENIANILKAYPSVQLKLGGYTDNTGADELNMRLSQQRAEAVAAAVAARGVGADRLVSEGYGSAHPVASNATEEGRAQNRRIDVRVRQR